MKFSEQHRLSVQLRHLLIRPGQAALLSGSGEVVAGIATSGGPTPVSSQHLLVLYAFRYLEKCVRRLESGEGLQSSNSADPVRMPKAEPITNNTSFLDQAREIRIAKPRLLGSPEAAIFVGSVALLEELRQNGLIKPFSERHRLGLFPVPHLEDCVARVECGERPEAFVVKILVRTTRGWL